MSAPIPGSHARNFDTCSGSKTPSCPPSPCLGAEDEDNVAFPFVSTRSAHEILDFGAQWLACVSTYLGSVNLCL
jgi:hypothetical protein